MKKNTVNRILQETEFGYDAISKKFSETRKHFWRGLEFIKDYTHENENVLDFGCGNGRLLELLGSVSGIQYFGVDVSGKLIEIAKNNYPGDKINFSKINPSQSTIALADNFFNTIYSIAVFHHFPSVKYRETIAKELFAKTKKGGTIVVTVWYLWPSFASLRRGWQQKYFKNILKNWFGKFKGQSKLDWFDCEISFTDNQGRKVQRFHHAFTKGELRKLFEMAGFQTEKCEVVEGRNILYIGRK